MGGIIQISKNNYYFEELKYYFEHKIYMKVQQGYVLKYLNLWIIQYPLVYIIGQNYHVKELTREWFHENKYIIFDTPFRTDSDYEE